MAYPINSIAAMKAAGKLVDLQNPVTWMTASLAGLHVFLQDVGEAMQLRQKQASALEKAGAVKAAAEMRIPENLDAMHEIETVYNNRIRAEFPEIETVLGEHANPKERLQFAKQHGYPMEAIMAEQQATIESEKSD